MKTLRTGPLFAVVCVVGTIAATGGGLNAQVPKGTFAWFAELVAFERKSNSVTVKARIEPHVVRYAGGFKPGERIAMVWSNFNGNADAIRYVTAENDLDAQAGYVVRGHFVSADAAGLTLTFTVSIPPASAATLAQAQTGTPIRVSERLIPTAATRGPLAVAVNVTAPLRQEPVKRMVDETRRAAGTWTVETTMPGNKTKLLCTFTQDVNKLGGSCKGPDGLADIPLTGGSVDRDIVSFSFELPMQGAKLPIQYRGTLDASGTTIVGNAGFLADSLDFKATKQ